MNDLQITNINGLDCYEKDGTVYLKLEAVARGLGFVDNSKDVEYVRWNTVRNYLKEIGFSQEVAKDDFIPENIFYRLAMKAKNETAEKFQAWVADEVIPSIRQTGAYITGQETASEDELIERALLAVHKRLEMREKQIAEQKEVITEQATVIETQTKQIEEMKPTVEYADKVLNSKNLLSATQVGKCFGMSAQKLNALLHEWGIHYKQNEQWVLYSPYDSKGYTKSVTRSYPYGDGSQGSRQETQWTEKGKQFVYEQMLKHGIISKEGTLI